MKKTWTYFIIFFVTWRSISQLSLVLPKLFVLPSTSQILTKLKHVFVHRKGGWKFSKHLQEQTLGSVTHITEIQFQLKSSLHNPILPWPPEEKDLYFQDVSFFQFTFKTRSMIWAKSPPQFLFEKLMIFMSPGGLNWPSWGIDDFWCTRWVPTDSGG